MKKIVIAEKLIRYRKEKGITQMQLAKILGVCHQAVSKWERYESYPDIIFLPNIAGLLSCSIDDFFEND